MTRCSALPRSRSRWAGALTLDLVRDGVRALDDPIARWRSEAASLGVLVAATAHPTAPPSSSGRSPSGTFYPWPTAGVWCSRTRPCRETSSWRGWPTCHSPSSPATDGCTRPASRCSVYSCPAPLGGHCPTCLPNASPSRWAWPPRASGPTTSTALQRPTCQGLTVSSCSTHPTAYSSPARLRELGGGLESTALEVLGFYCAMADGGGPVLTTDSVALMTDALTERPAPARAAHRRSRRVVGPRHCGGRQGGATLDGARPLGLGRRHERPRTSTRPAAPSACC